jgi:hypothetical protein
MDRAFNMTLGAVLGAIVLGVLPQRLLADDEKYKLDVTSLK